MKTLSGTSKIVVLITVLFVALGAFQAFAKRNQILKEEGTIILKIKSVVALKDGDNGIPALKAALDKVKTNGGLYEINYHNGNRDEDYPVPTPYAKLDIKTDKVRISETARNAAADEFTPIQVHVTQQISSNKIADIQGVVNLLQ